jgi:predicted metalloenzyme YecM
VNLSSVFTNVAHKVLVTVDLPDLGSNQHELNGVSALKEFFGTSEPIQGNLSWHYFADDQEPLHSEGAFTFYDARAKSADRTGRSEWRFYYEGSFLGIADVGDRFFLARSHSGQLFGLVFEGGSAWLRAAQSLFGVEVSTSSFDSVPRETLNNQELELLRRQILDELGLDLAMPVLSSDEDLMLETFGKTFPKTKEMALFAWSQVEVDPSNPDETLVRWLNREEELFRALENVVIGERLEKGFQSVDEFIEYSLSVQNRRKSRMGFALQNHLAELFTVHRLRFTPQARTEANNRPDFIFPGQNEYHDEGFDAALLVMLGVKSTSKDRWRQVLTEADRIPGKHLCTLEAGISTKQTEEMARQQLALVIPTTLHATYTNSQRETLLSVEQFIEFVREKQN